jgi:DNA-binding transcriptional LysR family regulator
MQDLLNYHAFRAGRRLKLRIRLNGSDLMCQMVEKGIGVAILPETAARRCQQSMAIQVIPLTDTWTRRHLKICVRSFRSLPVHAQRLVEFLRPSHAGALMIKDSERSDRREQNAC